MDDKGQPLLALRRARPGRLRREGRPRCSTRWPRRSQGGPRPARGAFAEFEEFLLPDRKGIATAIVRAAKGERDAAVADLENVTAETTRTPLSRLLAVDGLIHLGAWPQVVARARPMMLQAEKDGDIHLAIDLCARLEHVFKATGDRAALQELAPDAARLSDMHDHMHPGHRHRR